MNVIDAAFHLAEIYARALFELAERSKMVNAIKDELNLVQDISVQEKDFRVLMASPYFSADYKEQMVQKMFSGKLSDLTIDFLRVVIQHDRMVFLPQIIDRFGELWEAHHGYRIVQVTVSEAMNSQENEVLSANIASAMNNKVKLQVGVNPSIMGGIIIRYGDRVIDNSIRSRLRRAVNTIMSRQKAGKNQ
ncbi:MAG: ATP synthase F1 subunit delta [Planctomycetota bacterium]|nr:ATP synthase F1 subunit delta [Planctomycetota bacterium]